MKEKTTVRSFLQKLQHNENHALKELYSLNYRKVEAYILQNNGTHELAKDIYQEAFWIVWQHIKTERFKEISEDSVNGYLYQIAKNKWLDHLRSATYKKTIQLNASDMDALKKNEIAPESLSEEDEKLAMAMEAFKKLGDECKKLLLKFYFHRKSMREIAEIINIDEASARNKKFRCMQKLRELI